MNKPILLHTIIQAKDAMSILCFHKKISILNSRVTIFSFDYTTVQHVCSQLRLILGLNMDSNRAVIKNVNNPKAKCMNLPGRKAPAAHPGTSLDLLLL